MANNTEEEKGPVVEVLTAVGAAVAFWGLSKLFGGAAEKMMKAPGKDYFIPRRIFEANPAQWFRNHR